MDKQHEGNPDWGTNMSLKHLTRFRASTWRSIRYTFGRRRPVIERRYRAIIGGSVLAQQMPKDEGSHFVRLLQLIRGDPEGDEFNFASCALWQYAVLRENFAIQVETALEEQGELQSVEHVCFGLLNQIFAPLQVEVGTFGKLREACMEFKELTDRPFCWMAWLVAGDASKAGDIWLKLIQSLILNSDEEVVINKNPDSYILAWTAVNEKPKWFVPANDPLKETAVSFTWSDIPPSHSVQDEIFFAKDKAISHSISSHSFMSFSELEYQNGYLPNVNKSQCQLTLVYHVKGTLCKTCWLARFASIGKQDHGIHLVDLPGRTELWKFKLKPKLEIFGAALSTEYIIERENGNFFETNVSGVMAESSTTSALGLLHIWLALCAKTLDGEQGWSLHAGAPIQYAAAALRDSNTDAGAIAATLNEINKFRGAPAVAIKRNFGSAMVRTTQEQHFSKWLPGLFSLLAMLGPVQFLKDSPRSMTAYVNDLEAHLESMPTGAPGGRDLLDLCVMQLRQETMSKTWDDAVDAYIASFAGSSVRGKLQDYEFWRAHFSSKIKMLGVDGCDQNWIEKIKLGTFNWQSKVVDLSLPVKMTLKVTQFDHIKVAEDVQNTPGLRCIYLAFTDAGLDPQTAMVKACLHHYYGDTYKFKPPSNGWAEFERVCVGFKRSRKMDLPMFLSLGGSGSLKMLCYPQALSSGHLAELLNPYIDVAKLEDAPYNNLRLPDGIFPLTLALKDETPTISPAPKPRENYEIVRKFSMRGNCERFKAPMENIAAGKFLRIHCMHNFDSYKMAIPGDWVPCENITPILKTIPDKDVKLIFHTKDNAFFRLMCGVLLATVGVNVYLVDSNCGVCACAFADQSELPAMLLQ